MKTNVLKCVYLAIAASLLLSACSVDAERNEAGEVEETQEISIDKIKDGDCFTDPEELSTREEVELSVVTVNPCSETHDSQVYYSYEAESLGVAAEAAEKCPAAFDEKIGLSYEESALDYGYFTLGAKGDKVLCFAYNADLSKLDRSILGSNL